MGPVSIHVDEGDQVECDCRTSLIDPEGYLVIRIHPPGQRSRGLELFMGWDRLARLHAAIGARMAAHGRAAAEAEAEAEAVDGGRWERAWREGVAAARCLAPDGGADRCDIVPIPAEAAGDCGDLLPGEFAAPDDPGVDGPVPSGLASYYPPAWRGPATAAGPAIVRASCAGDMP